MAVVYQHRRKDTNGVFYIGIGDDRKRAYQKNGRSEYWKNVVNKVGYDVDVLLEGLSWEDACVVEIGMIKDYGRKDLGLGLLVNETDGGDGATNPSTKTRKLIGESSSKRNKGEGNPMYGKGYLFEGSNNPFYGKTHKKETINKISNFRKGKNFGIIGSSHHLSKSINQINLLTNEVINTYGSSREASRETGADQSSIIKCCKGKQNKAGGYKWEYVN